MFTAGVSAGFSANLLLTSLDPLLSGLSQEAAQLVDPAYIVQQGLCHVPEGREVFPLLSVHDNLMMGVFSAVFTLLILIGSEIIPKTLGALHPFADDDMWR